MNEKLQNYIDWIQYDELIAGVSNCPHNILGNHIRDGHQIIAAYRPNAEWIKIYDRNGKKEKYLDQIDDKGFFAIYLEKEEYKDYYFEVKYYDGLPTNMKETESEIFDLNEINQYEEGDEE